MPGSENSELKLNLKTLIIRTCRKQMDPNDLPDDVPIIGEGSALELDSLDVLELSGALLSTYGIRIMDSKDAFRIMKSINALADVIEP